MDSLLVVDLWQFRVYFHSLTLKNTSWEIERRSERKAHVVDLAQKLLGIAGVYVKFELMHVRLGPIFTTLCVAFERRSPLK